MNRKEVFYNIILIFIGIPTLLNVSNFFVNILSFSKYWLFELKYAFIYSPSDPLSAQFSSSQYPQIAQTSHVFWSILAIMSFFVSIFLFIKIRELLYSDNYSALKKTGFIITLIILMPVLTNAADISQEVAAMYAFKIDTRLAVISGIQENYLQMIGEIKFAIMNFFSDGYFSQSTVQTSVSMYKINRIKEYTDDANESFKTCLLQLEEKVLHGAISRISGDDFKECLNSLDLELDAKTGPHEEWNRTYGGIHGDKANDVIQTLDGGYVVAGAIEDLAFLIKTDAIGREQWNKTFGNNIMADSVQQTLDGGYILVSHAQSDVLLINTDSNGEILWKKIFGRMNQDIIYSVRQTSDGGYVLTGWHRGSPINNDDALLIKTDSNGNEQWNKTFGGMNHDGVSHVEQTSDNGYILSGMTDSFGHNDAWLIKTDSNGNEQWNKTFKTLNNTYFENAWSVRQTSDRGYIFIGIMGPIGDYSIWLVKTDANGNEQWNKTFGKGVSRSVSLTEDGGYILIGDKLSKFTKNDILIIKTDIHGNEQWRKVVGGINDDSVSSIQQTSDNGYILSGLTNSYGAGNYDAWLVKIAAYSRT